MKKTLLICATVLVAAVVFTSCKPTEKNYQAAYDVAKAKKTVEADDPDMALMLGGHTLDRSEGGTAVSSVDGMKLPLKSTSLRFETPLEGDGDWFLAVARYSMPTNARAQARDLKSKGDNVGVVEDSDSEWYVIAGVARDRREAGEIASRFIRTHPGFSFIGLDGFPMLLTSGTR